MKGDKQTILVVDDTIENLDILRGILAADYQLLVANSGQKALDIISGKRPDLILLDIMMPEMDGYEVCKRVKNDLATKHIPIIFVTAKDEVEDEKEGFELGAVDYITKPVNPEIVKVRVKTHLKLKDTEQKLKNSNNKLRLILSETLIGSIDVMLGLLGLTNSLAFSHALRLKQVVRTIVRKLKMKNAWEIEIAASLMPLGGILIPSELLVRIYTGENVKRAELEAYEVGPLIIASLLTNIPLFEGVGAMISYNSSFNEKNDLPEDKKIGAEILKIADYYCRLITMGKEHQEIVNNMRQDESYNTFILDRLEELKEFEKEEMVAKKVKVKDLSPGMELEEDVYNSSGILVTKKGTELFLYSISVLMNYHKNQGIKEPIQVLVPRSLAIHLH